MLHVPPNLLTASEDVERWKWARRMLCIWIVLAIAFLSLPLLIGASDPSRTADHAPTGSTRKTSRDRETIRISPADVLGGSHWAPLTGDGSN